MQIKGKVRARPEGQVNKDMKTGAIEVLGLDLTILNKSAPLPLDSNQVNSEEHYVLNIATLIYVAVK